MWKAASIVAAITLTAALTARAQVRVSEFASRGLEDWQTRSFRGQTSYQLVDIAGRRVLDARAHASASGLYRRVDVDLDVTPHLSWSWWVEAPLEVDDVRARTGDDFAARVYVVFSGGLRFWRTTSLVYVWADAAAPTETWRNPFTGQAAMIALRHGGGHRWQSETRNVVADYQRAFGKLPPQVSAVAVMTDTDQTGATAHARYADLRFE
jgi:hypothetical protein